MGKKKNAGSDNVTTIRPPGPLASWRLSLAVGLSALTTGRALLTAAETGQQLDLALGRSFAAAALVWFACGRVNRVMADAQQRSDEAARNAPRDDDTIELPRT